MIGLTIDIDYFQYEDPMWDWGHSEENPIFASPMIWTIRHSQIDIFEECSVEKADIHPSRLFSHLLRNGYTIDKTTKVGCGWSHQYAYDFFQGFDRVINIDAHHDIWEHEDVNCGSWGHHLLLAGTDIRWVVPKYALEGGMYDEFTYAEAGALPMDDIGRFASKIDAIYICQSPMWVAPMNDKWYHYLVHTAMHLARKRKLSFNAGFYERKMPTATELEKARQAYQTTLQNFKGGISG